MRDAQSAEELGHHEPPQSACVDWCISEHGNSIGEEDWVHESESLRVAPGVTARLCMSIDPVVGAQDGPFVIIDAAIDAREYTLPEAEALATSMMALARRGDCASTSG